MARKHRARHASPRPAPAAKAEPVSGAMAALAARTSEIDRREESRRDRDFQPKPRAIRRYEKYAGMGD